MRDALKLLGYDDVHHMLSVFVNPLEADMWLEALDAQEGGKPWGRKDWDALLGHCQVRLVFRRHSRKLTS